MSNEVSDTLLNDLISVSESMVEAAKEARWDDLTSKDDLRRQLLDKLSEGGHAFDPGRFLLASQTLTQLDQQVLQYVRNARDNTAADHKQHKSNQKALSQYQVADRPAA